jgi:hypothetical protein
MSVGLLPERTIEALNVGIHIESTLGNWLHRFTQSLVRRLRLADKRESLAIIDEAILRPVARPLSMSPHGAGALPHRSSKALPASEKERVEDGPADDPRGASIAIELRGTKQGFSSVNASSARLAG